MASNFEFDRRCCWCWCHVVQGAQAISIAELSINGLLFVFYLALLSPVAIANVVATTCSAIALLGLCKKSQRMVLVGVIYHALAAGVLLLSACVTLVVFILVDGIKRDILTKGICAMLYLFIYGVLCIWFLNVFYAAYQYLNDLDACRVCPASTQPGIVLSARRSSAGSSAAVGAPSVQPQPDGGAQPAPRPQPAQAPTTSAGGTHEAPPPTYEDALKQ